MNSKNTINSQDIELLIVEDDDLLLPLMAKIFARRFKRVYTSKKTDEGLTIIENKLLPHSTVISDHHNDLSPYHGAELAKISEEVRKAKHIPFFLMSGGLYGKDAEKAEIEDLIAKQTITGFIQKPFSNAEIKEVILSAYKPKA